jgi:hypothetical protein
MVGEASGHRSYTSLERHHPDELDRCLDDVERTFTRYPLRLLQVVGNEHRPFLYDIDWTESVSLAALHADDGGIVRFRPGAGDELTQLAPLLRPLIELHWMRMVASLNDLDLEGERLRAHLFGTNRVGFPLALRSGLRELQDGRCFYCDDPLTGSSEVDHFIPWSRWPNDAIENLVLADRCNNHKRDHLAAADHAGRWAHRLAVGSAELSAIATTARWSTEPARTLAIGRSSYFHLPTGTPLWVLGGLFADDDPRQIAAVMVAS